MDETMDKKRPLSDLMRSTMDKIREMADTNTIVGQPITTPDGVTLIPISRVSMGFGCGGADYGKTQPKDFGGGSGAGVKIEPVAFLVIREGTTRVLPVAMPPMTTLDLVVMGGGVIGLELACAFAAYGTEVTVVEMMPDLVDKVEKYFDKKEEKEPV